MTIKPERRIEGLVEYYGADESGGVQCARCGSSIDFDLCPDCGGEGFVESPDEDSWAYIENELERCGLCAGAGGWWQCLSSVEYCKANPLPGREHSRFPLDRDKESI